MSAGGAPATPGELAFEVADVLKGVREVVPTRHGPLAVTVLGDRSKAACLAVPDAGLNHRTCFRSLIVASGPASLLLKNFFVAFLDPAGCELPALDPPPSPRPTSLEALAEQVADVVAALKLREVLGLGVGTGAYVLIKAAAAAPKVFCGLALLSPAVTRAGWWEWAASAAAATSLSWRGWTPAARDHFAQRLLSLASLQLYGGDSDLVRALRRDVGDVPAPAAAAGLRAAAARADATADVGRLRCRLLLVYGAEGIYAGDALALGAAADKGRFALVEVPGAGVLVGEERAGELVSPLQLFLTNLQLDGYGLGASLQVGE